MSEHPDEQTALLAKEQRHNFNKDDLDEDNNNNNKNYGTTDPEGPNVNTSSSLPPLEFKCNRYLIEVVVFCLLFAYNLSAVIVKCQILHQTCTFIFGYNESDCKMLGRRNESQHIKEIETIIQPYASKIFVTMTIIENIIPAVFVVFVGSWSDRFGRKPFILASFIGFALYYVIAFAISYMNVLHPISPWYFLLAVVPNTVLGGYITFGVGVYCYISDTTATSKKPLRMTIYEVIVYIGLMVGALSSGYMFEAFNSRIIFLTSATILSFAVLLIIFFIPESLQSPTAPSSNQSLLNCDLFRDLFKACFQNREHKDRCVLWLALISLLTASFIIQGSSSVFYLFIRKKFNWTVKEFTNYETCGILISAIGNIVGFGVLKNIFKLSMVNMAMVAFFSHFLSSLMKGFAAVDIEIYVALLLGVLKGIANPMCRTIISNIVPANELGKIFSFYGALQALTPFFASALFTFIYNLTLLTDPGFFNLLSAQTFLLCCCYMFAILRIKKANREHYDPLLG